MNRSRDFVSVWEDYVVFVYNHKKLLVGLGEDLILVAWHAICDWRIRDVESVFLPHRVFGSILHFVRSDYMSSI